jgi:hypothetical protein
MFRHPDSPWQRGALFALALLWACLLFGGFLLGSPDEAGGRRMPAWSRLASSLTLVLAAWAWYAAARHGPAARFGACVAVGMTLGWVGDLCMAGLMPLPGPVLGGMAAFGLGHVAYVTAALSFGNREGLARPGARWGAWAGWLLIGLAGWYFVALRGRQPTALHAAALPYALLLASTAGCATGLALQRPAFVPFALGAGLFLLSDLLLAAHLFNQSGLAWVNVNDLVWLTYGPGQMLIVYSVGSALIVAGGRGPSSPGGAGGPENA